MLRTVSRAMRVEVEDTGRTIAEICANEAAELGCLRAVERLQARGLLQRREYLYQAAAASGQLEKLKLFRTNGVPWDEGTCSGAAEGGHLDVLQWAHANDCPRNAETCARAAGGGHLEVLQWARASRCRRRALRRGRRRRRGCSGRRRARRRSTCWRRATSRPGTY